MLLSKITLAIVALFAFVHQAIAFCSRTMTHLLATEDDKTAFAEHYVHSAMHCVLLCIQTHQCEAVGLSRYVCRLYKGKRTGRGTPSQKTESLVLLVRKATWPKRFVGDQMQRKQDAIGNRVTSLAVISHTTAIIKPPSSTEGHLTVASSTLTSLPSPTSSPLAVRRMTKGACRKHNGYTFMPGTSMCMRHSTGNPVTWFEARQICRAEGGDLVKLTSSWKGRVCHDFVHYKPVKKPYWIGLQINAHGGRWVGGGSMVYCNFMFNIVPTASSPVCVMVNKGLFHIWKKADCNSTDVKNFVCEIV